MKVEVATKNNVNNYKVYFGNLGIYLLKTGPIILDGEITNEDTREAELSAGLFFGLYHEMLDYCRAWSKYYTKKSQDRSDRFDYDTGYLTDLCSIMRKSLEQQL
jgi:hypothetical protein